MKNLIKNSIGNKTNFSKFQELAISKIGQKNVKGGEEIVIEDIVEQ